MSEKDVAVALGYQEPRSAVSKKVDEIDRGVAEMETPSGRQEMTIINESGLYTLIFGSKLESAKRFKHWVTSEVLPSIRKTGAYTPSQASADIPLGELASYLKAMDRVAMRQGTAPHKIAETFKAVSEQFGVQLPADFVKVPDYEQLAIFGVFGGNEDDE